jgi:ATP-dependent DNA helicase RecQ
MTGREDAELIEHFTRSAFPPEDRLVELLRVIEGARDGLTRAEIEGAMNVGRGQLEKALSFLSADDLPAVVKQDRKWHRTIHPYRFDRARVDSISRQRREEWQQVQDYIDHTGCLQVSLASALDDPEPALCGRCTPCAGSAVVPVGYDDAVAARAERLLRDTDVRIPPRKRTEGSRVQPFGAVASIPRDLLVEPGDALCAWGDTFWFDLVSAGKAAGKYGDEVIDEVACMVRDRWRPQPAPTWVTCVPSLRSPPPVPDLAHRLAARLGLPFSPCVRKVRETEPQKSMENSVHQARNIDGAFAIDAGLVHRGPVLLVDDVVDSRWTFAIVGALLRQVVIAPVYPRPWHPATPRLRR